jgi:hypothetical protein
VTFPLRFSRVHSSDRRGGDGHVPVCSILSAGGDCTIPVARFPPPARENRFCDSLCLFATRPFPLLRPVPPSPFRSDSTSTLILTIPRRILWDGWDGLGRLWDGCKSENRPCLPALGRWDGCTPPKHPPPPTRRLVRQSFKRREIWYPPAKSRTRSHRTTLRRRYPALSGTNRHY